jgi:hypothetical protein
VSVPGKYDRGRESVAALSAADTGLVVGERKFAVRIARSRYVCMNKAECGIFYRFAVTASYRSLYPYQFCPWYDQETRCKD